jgi:hypothetical protein
MSRKRGRRTAGAAPASNDMMPALALLAASMAITPSVLPLDVHQFRVLSRDSGPNNYYRTIDEAGHSFIRGTYRPSLQTVTLFEPVPDSWHRGAKRLSWRWRALVLPRGGNECVPGKGDAAANVYVTWKRGLKWYSVKLIWSSEGDIGRTCNRIRNPFVASDSVILRSGAATGRWEEEEVDPDALFREHFGDDIPELQGIGLLTDGDQTQSVSAADFADFVLYR